MKMRKTLVPILAPALVLALALALAGCERGKPGNPLPPKGPPAPKTAVLPVS
jgi:hypothetical protein